jgi:hypothetical protein
MRKNLKTNNLEQVFMLDKALDIRLNQNQACAWIRFTWAFILVG